MSGSDELKLAATVGAAIAMRRKQKGMTQAEFAEFLDIGQDSLSRMEKGVIAPKFSRLQRIADGLDCSVADLFRQPSDPVRLKAESIIDKLHPLRPEFQDAVVDLVDNMVKTLKKIS